MLLEYHPRLIYAHVAVKQQLLRVCFPVSWAYVPWNASCMQWGRSAARKFLHKQASAGCELAQAFLTDAVEDEQPRHPPTREAARCRSADWRYATLACNNARHALKLLQRLGQQNS